MNNQFKESLWTLGTFEDHFSCHKIKDKSEKHNIIIDNKLKLSSTAALIVYPENSDLLSSVI